MLVERSQGLRLERAGGAGMRDPGYVFRLHMVAHVLSGTRPIAAHPTEEMAARRVTLPPDQSVQLLQKQLTPRRSNDRQLRHILQDSGHLLCIYQLARRQAVILRAAAAGVKQLFLFRAQS